MDAAESQRGVCTEQVDHKDNLQDELLGSPVYNETGFN